jgi:diadenosine tetraphosphate (Ap4A) HIT family hydrolase
VSCSACDLASGKEPLPGGTILDGGRWLVEHCVGPLGVGTLVVKPRRHVLHVADLDDAEAEELGPLLRRCCALVTELVGADQVYVTLWSHAGGEPVHIHYVVQPVTRAQLEETGLHGPRLQVAMFTANVPPDPDEVAAFGDRARAWLASGSAA